MMNPLIAATAMIAASLSPAGQSVVTLPPEQIRPAAPMPAPALRLVLTEGGADGSRGSMATVNASVDAHHLWFDSTSCGIGATSSSPPAGATSWRVTGRIVSEQAGLYTVEIDAVRVGGPPPAGAPASPRTLTMRLDERVPIDRAAASGACGSGEVRLEAMVTSGSFSGAGMRNSGGGRGVGVGGGRGGGGGAAAISSGRAGGGGAGAAMSGRGGGSASASASTNTTSTSTSVTGTRPSAAIASGRGGRGIGPVTAVPPGSVILLRAPDPPVDADLWLVHRGPSGPEQYQQLTMRIGSPFTFPVVNVTTTQGPVTVEVSGSIYERVLNGVADGLAVEIKRRVKGDGPSTVDYLGSSTRQLPMPTAADVVSFPIPNGMTESTRVTVVGDERRGLMEQVAATVPIARLLQGHEFELRLRIKAK